MIASQLVKRTVWVFLGVQPDVISGVADGLPTDVIPIPRIRGCGRNFGEIANADFWRILLFTVFNGYKSKLFLKSRFQSSL
jgi:hypothetical protein